MDPDSSQTPTTPRRRSYRGIARWLVRFALLSAVVMAGVLILVAVIAGVVYLNRVQIVNRTLAYLVEPFRVSVGELDFHPLGTVRIRDLRLAPKNAPGDAWLADIPETEITYRFREMRATRRFEDITLRGPVIRLDEAMFDALAPGETTDADPKPLLLSRLALFTGTLSVTNGRFEIEKPGLPRLEGTWSFQTGALDFDEAGLIRTPFAWTVSDFALGPDGKNGSLASFTGSGRVSADLKRFDFGPITLRGAELDITPDLFPPTKEGSVTDPTVSLTTLSGPAPELNFERITAENVAVRVSGFDGPVPDIAFETGLTLEDVSFRESRWQHPGPIHLTLTEPQAGSGGTPFFTANRIDLSAGSLDALVSGRRFGEVSIGRADLLLTGDSLSRFLGDAGNETADEPDKTTRQPWIIDRLSVGTSSLLMEDLEVGGKAMPEISSSFEGTLHDLRFAGGQAFASDGLQNLVLGQTRIRAPGAGRTSEPLLGLERTEVELNWSDFNRDNRIRRLNVRGPKIEFTDAALGDWLRGGEPGEEVARPIDRPVYKVEDLKISGGRLVADSSFAAGKVPKIEAGFTIETLPPRDDDPFSYRLQLDEFSIRNHARAFEFVGPPRPGTTSTGSPLNEGDVFRVKRIDLDFTAAELQRTRRLGKLKLDGASLIVGEGLRAIVDEGKGEEKPTASPQAAAPAPRDLPTWTIGEIEITRSRVSFESLIPQVEGLDFAIETKLNEVPLSLDGILAQETPQKIELAGIEIRDPYNSFITVAELPTIFVEFRLAGLARQEVDRIDLIGPSLHVGQGLFWWIDYQRKFRKQNEGASIGIDSGIEPEKKADWVIRTINASAGKIIISPTGVPIGAVPFPFNATTNMSEGNIELKLSIPDEDHVYEFPDYKVALEGLAGDVMFNVPVKDVNNNLVQTFTLRKAKWKDFDASNLYISVTFDANGVYGKFGGEAYKGYAEGQFNFYLNDRGKWDAWIAGTDLDTGPVTAVLVPDSFLMDGRVSLKLVSEGRDKVVGETSGDFQTTTPGWFDVTKLDKILETLPPEWNSLQRSLTELSLVALKRFDYDSGKGDLYFLNREGRLDLRFGGDYGTRQLKLQVHDERNTKLNLTETAAAPVETGPVPVPEANVRPATPARVADSRRNR